MFRYGSPLREGEPHMKIKSVSGLALYVRNLTKTTAFYEALGFETRKRAKDHVTVYSNWFWIDFLAIGKDERTRSMTEITGKGSGVLIYLSVENVDEFHTELLSKKLKPATK